MAATLLVALSALVLAFQAHPEGRAISGQEQATRDFAAYVERLRAEARARGISEAILQQAFANLEPSPTVIQRDRSQVEAVLTVEQYLQRRLTPPVVRTGKEMARRYRTLLARVSDAYGVPPQVVVAIWGLESNYGRFSGVRPTIQALATLAWEGRREAFFRSELMDALEIVERGHIELEWLRGSWAGAMGQPQFMPSSYLRFAEDFDGDGRRDIWSSPPDIFASIANYLRAHGWVAGYTWGREVRLPESGLAALRASVGVRDAGCRAEREMTLSLPLDEWQKQGVRTAAGRTLPSAPITASLVHTGTRAFLVYQNYEALLEYNCAHSYALAVALLSNRIAG